MALFILGMLGGISAVFIAVFMLWSRIYAKDRGQYRQAAGATAV